MKHAIVYDPPTLGGTKAILATLLKLAGLALILVALMGFPALSQQLAPRMLPALLESDPSAIMRLETERARHDSASRLNSIGGHRSRGLPLDATELRDSVDETIHFDLGSSKVRSDASVKLRETLVRLRSVPDLRIRIEGQADVPGSTAYDITLAWDRAGAAKVWLINHGMDPDRIDAVGYSDGRALCGHRIGACSLGIRRDEFLIVAGPDAVVRGSP